MTPKIISKRTIADTRYLTFVDISYLDKNGKPQNWSAVERPNETKAVVIVPIVGRDGSNPKLAITREYRVPIQGYEYGFPAGLLDKYDESPIDAAERELFEETGLRVLRVIRGPSPFVFNSPGLTNESCCMVSVEAYGEPSSKHTEDSEDITTLLLDRDGVKKLMLEASDSQIMIGAKAWIIFDRFVTHGDV